jgi:hypothetical protein
MKNWKNLRLMLPLAAVMLSGHAAFGSIATTADELGRRLAEVGTSVRVKV